MPITCSETPWFSASLSLRFIKQVIRLKWLTFWSSHEHCALLTISASSPSSRKAPIIPKVSSALCAVIFITFLSGGYKLNLNPISDFEESIFPDKSLKNVSPLVEMNFVVVNTTSADDLNFILFSNPLCFSDIEESVEAFFRDYSECVLVYEHHAWALFLDGWFWLSFRSDA